MPLAYFWIKLIPDLRMLLIGLPLSGIWAWSCLWSAGALKKYQQFPTGYTRKIFHFLIFGAAVIVQWLGGLKAIAVFGGGVSGVIFYALYRGRGHILYEALAREKDAPCESAYIVIPYLTTLTGGLCSNLWFGDYAMIGYLVTGIGDAIAEPVGTRWGKHVYRVPTLGKMTATRSYEGSLAVLLASCAIMIGGILLLDRSTFGIQHVGISLLLGSACMFVEAFSPHGWDNATMQIIPPFLFKLTLTF